MATNSYQRTSAYMQKLGWKVTKVEQWVGLAARKCNFCHQFNPPMGSRKDAFGFGDVLAVHPKHGIALVQACGQDFASHVVKMTTYCEPEIRDWLQAGGRIYLVGWRKLLVKRGGKVKRWYPRIMQFSLTNLGRTDPRVSIQQTTKEEIPGGENT